MSTQLLLKPCSAPIGKLSSIHFEVNGISSENLVRIKFENATNNSNIIVSNLSSGFYDDKFIYLDGSTSINGNFNLNVSDDFEGSIISIYANIETQVGNSWVLSDIAAFTFQIEESLNVNSNDKIYLYPPFVNMEDKFKLTVHSDANSIVYIYINGKKFISKTNSKGEGQCSVRGADVFSFSDNQSMQKFVVKFSKSTDNHSNIYNSGVYVHIVPSLMKALQSTNDPQEPYCVIFDPEPGPGLQLHSLDQFCFEGSVVGEGSVFTKNNGYVNSRVGFCSENNNLSGSNNVCRIYSTSSSTLLPNGIGLVAYSSQVNTDADAYTPPVSASKIFISSLPTSLKYKSNPVRNGVVLKPSSFYHSVYVKNPNFGDILGIEFRLEDGLVFEVRFEVNSEILSEIEHGLASSINDNIQVQSYGISAINLTDRVDISSDSRFAIVVRTYGADINTTPMTVFSAKLFTNQILEVLVDAVSVMDVGNKVLFLSTDLGARIFEIESRSSPDILRLYVPQGVNNGLGPTVLDNIYCQNFIVFDSTSISNDIDLTQISPLPYILDDQNNEIPAINPSISARPDYSNGDIYAYVIAQAPVNGVYQLFLYSFRLGDSLTSNWIQLTHEGENRNAVAVCDHSNNLHVTWESDRDGPSQIYYGMLGGGSRTMMNQSLMSAIDQEAYKEDAVTILHIDDPQYIQNDSSWYRMIDRGSVSIVNGQKVAIACNAEQNAAMAIMSLDSDESGNPFEGQWSQISYQLSFDLSLIGDVFEKNITSNDINFLYENWSKQFVHTNNNKHTKNNNIFSLDRSDIYYENIIPICGSYNLDAFSDILNAISNVTMGGETVAGYDNHTTPEYIDLSGYATLSHGANVKHFVVGIIPEKVRFKAVNTESKFAYCDRNNFDSDQCDSYEHYIEEIHLTGNFSLCLLLATSEDESTGKVSDKKFHILKKYENTINFSNSVSHNFKIIVHYGRSLSDDIAAKIKRDPFAIDQNYRFYGDIVVLVDDKSCIAKSFAADFSDKIRRFEIGLGVPSGGKYLTNQILPYNGNIYSDIDFVAVYNNIAIGPHSVRPLGKYAFLSNHDRNTDRMYIPSSGPINMLKNGDFEISNLSPGTSLSLASGENIISNWDIIGGATYIEKLFASSKNKRCVLLNYAPDLVKSIFSSDIDGWTSIIPYNGDSYGGVAGTTQDVLHSLHSSYSDGYAYLQDNVNGISYWESPSKFLGNQISLYNGILHIRLRSSVIDSAYEESKDIIIEGVNNTLISIDISDPEDGEWHDYLIPIRAGEGWRLNDNVSGLTISGGWSDATENEILSILGNVRRFLIRGEYQNENGNMQYLDVVSFMRHSGISQSLDTITGEEYIVKFDLSALPILDAYGTIKKIRVEAGDSSQVFEYDITNHAVSDINQIDENFDMRWASREFRFTATSSYTSLRFLNESGLSQYSCCIDNISLYNSNDLIDEMSSNPSYIELGISSLDYNLAYSLISSDGFSQIPVTLPCEHINKSCSMCVDLVDKIHITWESNMYNFWDIFYTGNRNRSMPFRFHTRITKSESNSLKPSIGIDSKGRSLIAWHDDRNGTFQIYSAASLLSDTQILDICKIQESNDIIRNLNDQFDPYNPYSSLAELVGCQVSFDFEPPHSGYFHFSISFYEDFEHTLLVKTINSKNNIGNWRVNDIQIDYNGSLLSKNVTSNVTYDTSKEDDLIGKIYHIVIQHIPQQGVDVIHTGGSDKISVIDSTPEINIDIGQYESDSQVIAFVEFRGKSPVQLGLQVSSDFINDTPGATFEGLSFSGDEKSLPGCQLNQDISVTYFHWDPITVNDEGVRLSNVIIQFTEPIVAIIWKDQDLDNTDQYFAISGATYAVGHASRGLEFSSSNDSMTVSEDGLTLSVNLHVNRSNIDNFRVITSPRYTVEGSAESVYFCPHEQSSRCDVSFSYKNETTISQNVHFRVTAYSDPERESVVFSSFTLLNSNGWVISDSDFPIDGMSILPNQTSSIIFDPDVLPFSMFDSHNINENRNTILCGVPYYISIDVYVNDGFKEIENITLLCPCSYTDSHTWPNDTDSSRWICSGQGKSDMRITSTESAAINPVVRGANNNLIYIGWNDYRYSKFDISDISSDIFFAVYDTEKDQMHSSGQGFFDRRVTYANNDGYVSYDADLLVDQFQNPVFSFHDGNKFFGKSCSLGCEYKSTLDNKSHSCMFTDSTLISDTLTGRGLDQFQKIRVHKKWVAFSTYKDVDSPISVVNDCFIGLDIIGVPGTYAYRLKNEEDNDWTEWLPIGPDLPIQGVDSNFTITEQRFFRAYFIDKDRFIAPWISSTGNGLKRVCCEILTYFGKTSQFCVDFMAIYDEIKYEVDFFFDSDFTKSVPRFNSYPVISCNMTPSSIDNSNLFSLSETTTKVNEIFVRITFEDINRIERINSVRQLDRYRYLGEMNIDIFQQGINDIKNILLVKVEPGIYRASFAIAESDGVFNRDGMAIVIVNVPGQCKSVNENDYLISLQKIQNNQSLEQSTSIFNNLTLFKERYNKDDLRKSFGDIDYYRKRNFGIEGQKFDSSNQWFGGGGL